MNCFLYPLLCFLTSFPVESMPGNIESIINFGDSSYIKKNYCVALHEYQRAFFFADSELKCGLGEKTADCYFVLQDFKMARAFYDSAAHYTSHDSLLLEYSFRKILCFMMENDFGYAMLQLNNLEAVASVSMQRRKNLYQGICCFGMGQYEVSHEHFLNCIPLTDTLRRSRLQQLYENRNILKRPYSSLAVVLSILLPGSGQVYSGNLRDGFNSFLLVSGLFYLGTSGSIINPYVILPFSYRYYTGGILHAKQKAEEKRREKQFCYYTNLMEILLK